MKKAFTVANLQQLLKKIPKGKVTTYTELAKAFGSPRAARAIGTLCGKNPEPDVYPCFKVVKSDGSIGGFAYGPREKIRRLRGEGIEVEGGKVVEMKERVWRF